MIPEKIGRYNIDKELGRGGMAVVYLATDPFMSREVALKVLPRQFTFDPQFRARFQREAQVIAKLDHPAIVPVYDFGEHEEQPFIVMRYMKGGSLADQLKENGPFPVEKTAEILKRIGSALDEAHEKGIVHRDLKPGNILFDDRGDAFVADFGIVKMSEATIQYTGNAIIGTPGYMSPEQARGDDEVDGRSDIYSLGAIAYEMLTGKLPYSSDTPMGLVMKHILEPVPDLSVARPDLPATTGTVISTAMAKEPNMRFQTCSDIANALSQSATVQFAAGNLPLGGETVIENPGEIAGTVVQTPSRQTFPPTTVDQPVGYGTGTGAGTVGPATAGPATTGPAYTAEPEKKGGIPTWGIAAGCIVLLCIGGVIAASAFGVLGSILGNPTPTEIVVVADTATPERIEDATSTPEPTIAETATPETADPTPTFDLVPDDTPTPEAATPANTGPVGGGPVSIGSSSDGFVSANQSQEWTFTANAGDRIDVVVRPEEDFDLVFNILNPSRESIVPGGEVDNSFGAEQVLNLVLPDAGTYVITVAGYDGASGSYELLTDFSPDAPPGSTLSASDTLNSGSEHLFPFHSNGPVTVNAVVNPQDNLDVVLSIWDDNTDTMLEEVDASFQREELSFDLPGEGNFYFQVKGFDETQTGNYDITVTVPQEVILLLATRDEIFGSFSSIGYLDYYFRGDAGDIFTVDVSTSSDIDLVIEIYDEDDLSTTLDDIDDNLSGEDETLTFTLPADGLYVIRIKDFFSNTGSFIMILN